MHNQAFNVARNEDNYRIRELADIVKETVPGCGSSTRRMRAPTSAATGSTAARSRRPCRSSKPQWDARKGAQELLEAYRKVGLKLEDFEGPRYKRIDHIKMLLSDQLLDPTCDGDRASPSLEDL